MFVVVTFWIFAAIVVFAYIFAVIRLWFKRLPHSARALFILFTALQILLMVGFVYAYTVPTNTQRYWLLDGQEELNFLSMLTSLQFLLTGLAALGVAWKGDWDKTWQRWYWTGVALLFVLFAVDEFHSLHELTGNLWRVPALILGLVFVGLTALMFFREVRRRAWLLGPFLLSLAFGAFIATVYERYLVWGAACHSSIPFFANNCLNFLVFEEFGEPVVATVSLLAFIAFFQPKMYLVNWSRARRIGTLVGALWLVWMVSFIWLLPPLQARYIAEPAHVTYLDGDLALVGYRMTGSTLEPGDNVRIVVFWKINQRIQQDYGLSVHLLTADDHRSVAQVNVTTPGRYASSAWLPGTTDRLALRLSVPADLDTPQSLAVAVSLFRGSSFLEVDAADRQFWDSTVLLTLRPVLPADPPETPPQAAAYRFADAVQLAGYDLPDQVAAGDDLTFRLWWQVEQEIDTDWVQFVHVFDEAGDLVASLDAPPFSGRLPTSSWVAGMAFVQPVALPLPDDLPPGDYEVFTGLYQLPAAVRIPISLEGEAVLNAIIPLGTFEIQSD